jgi:hypothetical protein
MIWIQVRDVHAGHARLAAAGIPIIRGPATEPWGLTEMGIQDRQYRAYQCAISGDLADDPPPLTPVGTAAVMSPAGHERARSRP